MSCKRPSKAEGDYRAAGDLGEFRLGFSSSDSAFDHAVGATPPALDETTAVKDVGDVRISRPGGMNGLEILGRKSEWQGAVAPDFHPVVEDGDADRTAGV